MDRVKTIALSVTVALSLCFLTPAFAGDDGLNHHLMVDQKAALAKIDSMNIPDMPKELADSLRGGGFVPGFLKAFLIKKAVLFLPNKEAARISQYLMIGSSPEQIRNADPSALGWIVSHLPWWARPSVAY